ncbi:hypothetical protein ASZ90_006239 [hydrocarbon metagenome]|uniref:Uncharacterized protein n=1 Tax=hydrocarbon metagenome TaxID=938273 RepID=A0A0W8FSQ1_9ZZZZ
MSTRQLFASHVEGFQKLNGRIDAADIFMRKIKAHALMRAEGQKDRIIFFDKKVMNGNVFSQDAAIFHFDVLIQKSFNFLLDNIPGQSVGGKRAGKHAAGSVFRLENSYTVSQQRKVMGSGDTRRAGTDYGHLLFLLFRNDGFIDPRLHPVRHKSFKGTNSDGLPSAHAQVAATFALTVADPGTHGWKRIGRADDPVSLLVITFLNHGNISPWFSIHGTGGLTGSSRQLLADKSITPLVGNVPFVFFAEILKSTENRIGCSLAETAHGCIFHCLCQLLQKNHVFRCTLAKRDVFKNFIHPLRSFTAGETFATGLVFKKIHKIFGNVHHAGVLVHNNHATRSHDGSDLCQAVVIDA